MAQLRYDIISHDGGWAIMLTPGRGDTFPTQKDAFDTAAEFTRKLRFVGYSVEVRGDRDKHKARANAA